MKIYIAGKIAGDRRYRAKFREAAKTLEAAGHVVLNPATLPDGLTDGDYMRRAGNAGGVGPGRVPPGLPGEPGRHGGMGLVPADRERVRPVFGNDRRENKVKDFAEAYKAAHAKAREYTGAKRAGWAEPGKRTRENHAILIPRQEAVDTANNLATAIYAKEVYITWAMNLRGFMVQLATGEHDAVTCRECGGIFRAGWMNGKCPYCEAKQAATSYVDGMREAAGK
jgi:hypothetical protein